MMLVNSKLDRTQPESPPPREGFNIVKAAPSLIYPGNLEDTSVQFGGSARTLPMDGLVTADRLWDAAFGVQARASITSTPSSSIKNKCHVDMCQRHMPDI